jgi:hypothetical protein
VPQKGPERCGRIFQGPGGAQKGLEKYSFLFDKAPLVHNKGLKDAVASFGAPVVPQKRAYKMRTHLSAWVRKGFEKCRLLFRKAPVVPKTGPERCGRIFQGPGGAPKRA